mgnify:CR=1 FL=1
MKKVYKKAHEESNLVIGQRYLVAHVNVKNTDYPRGSDVPIIPIWHNDRKDFELQYSHYHLDGRFISNGSKQASIWHVKDGVTSFLVTDINNNALSEVFYKLKKCLRLTTGIHNVRFHKPEFIKRHLGKACKGRKCPHWGAVMNEIDGVLICPMHRLIGDLEKEIIIG